MPHLRPPSFSRGTTSFIWGFLLGAFIWLGMLAVGVSGGTSFVVGAVSGAAIFLLVVTYGGDEPPRRASSKR